MKKLRFLSLILVLCFVSALALTACEETGTESSAATDSNGDASTEVSYGEFQDSTGKYYASPLGSYPGKTVTFLTCSVNPPMNPKFFITLMQTALKRPMPTARPFRCPRYLTSALSFAPR